MIGNVRMSGRKRGINWRTSLKGKRADDDRERRTVKGEVEQRS